MEHLNIRLKGKNVFISLNTGSGDVWHLKSIWLLDSAGENILKDIFTPERKVVILNRVADVSDCFIFIRQNEDGENGVDSVKILERRKSEDVCRSFILGRVDEETYGGC